MTSCCVLSCHDCCTKHFYRTTLCVARTISCHKMAVCPSHAGIVSKRLNISSNSSNFFAVELSHRCSFFSVPNGLLIKIEWSRGILNDWARYSVARSIARCHSCSYLSLVVYMWNFIIQKKNRSLHIMGPAFSEYCIVRPVASLLIRGSFSPDFRPFSGFENRFPVAV